LVARAPPRLSHRGLPSGALVQDVEQLAFRCHGVAVRWVDTFPPVAGGVGCRKIEHRYEPGLAFAAVVRSIDPTGLASVSADDAYAIGQDATTQRPFIGHWDGTRWRTVPLGSAAHMQRLGPRAVEFRSPSLTVTSDGSIAALDTEGLHDRANFLWLRCQH
jgi:hypothetical protein